MKQRLLFYPLVLLILLFLASCSLLENRIIGGPMVSEDTPLFIGTGWYQAGQKKRYKGYNTKKNKSFPKPANSWQNGRKSKICLMKRIFLLALKLIRGEVKLGTSEQELAEEYVQTPKWRHRTG